MIEEPRCYNCNMSRDLIDEIIADRIAAGADKVPAFCCTVNRLVRLRPKAQTAFVQEAFIPPSSYPEIRGIKGVPNLKKFPKGVYIIGVWGFSKILAVSPEPMLEKMKAEQEKTTDAIQSPTQPPQSIADQP